MATGHRKRGAWGGRRPGAGRKPTFEDRVLVTFNLEREEFDRLVELAEAAELPLSHYLRRLVQRHLSRAQPRR